MPKLTIATGIALIALTLLTLAGCGSAGMTMSSAATTTRPASHAAKGNVDAKRHAAIEKLLKGGPAHAQSTLIDRECTVPHHATIKAWLDEEWSGRSIISVANQIAREIPNHATRSQRDTLALVCIGRISKTGS